MNTIFQEATYQQPQNFNEIFILAMMCERTGKLLELQSSSLKKLDAETEST